MAFINDRIFDFGLAVFESEANRLDICNREPSSFDEAISDFSLGNKIGIVIDFPENMRPTGRKVVISKIDDGKITKSGRAAFWAVADMAASRLLAAGPMETAENVTKGNLFSLTAFDVGIPDATE